jgi:hypothetical protein
MGQRDDRHHHANRRRRLEKASGGRARTSAERDARAPLAGYEALYEISRSGRIYSLTTRAVLVGGYHHSPVIRIAVNGTIVTLPKEKAVADSFARLDASK